MLLAVHPRSINKSALAVGICVFLLSFALRVADAETSPSASTHMIERAGHKIAFQVTPGHSPIIVLDAGGGLDSTYWNTLLPELAKRTGCKIITYDRAGFGRSDEVPGPWSVQSATDDLANGLERLGATRNVILVSHSLAGEIATYLARRHPQWILGVVLVHANVPEVFTDSFIERSIALYAPIIAATKAAPPSQSGRQLLALSQSFRETSEAFHRVTWPAAVPAIVIVSEQTPLDAAEDAQWWRDAHQQFANGSNNRKLVVADRSSHDVAHDRPDVIVQAVAQLLAGYKPAQPVQKY
jgi:pimeloyl-ACP methyl ester carboxylesterase